MATSLRNQRIPGLLGWLAAASLLGALWSCALKESTADDGTDGPGVVISVNDSTNVTLDFSNLLKTVFTDSGEFDLDDIRKKMKDKGLNPDSVHITGIVVTYDDSTKAFLTDNAGVKFVLKVYVRENDDTTKRLVLYTPAASTAEYKVQAFDPDQALFELNKHIFGSADGFPGLLSAIKDTTKHKEMCIAELTVIEALKEAGKLKLNMVVTVSGR